MNYIGPSVTTWTVRVQTATEQAALDLARAILEQHSELEVQIERGELYRAVRSEDQ